jgi:SAM-dependent methyltransferase
MHCKDGSPGELPKIAEEQRTMRRRSTRSSQVDFYARTAQDYDAWHVHAHDEHFRALLLGAALLRGLQARSVLDVGCGTGRAIAYLREHLPEGVRFKGIDPSPDLIRLAADKTGLGPDCFDVGGGESLPYDNGSFDVVVATGVLHHVQDPELVVAEMVRVARISVLISDMNTYGLGHLPYRALKIVAGRLGIRRSLDAIRYGGHRWFWSDDDGVAYPYSVYEAMQPLRARFDTVLVVPTAGTARMNTSPLWDATHLLAIGFSSDSVVRRAAGDVARGPIGWDDAPARSLKDSHSKMDDEEDAIRIVPRRIRRVRCSP